MSGRGPSADDVMVGARVAIVRCARRVSRRELGEAVGVTHQQIDKYERGANAMTAGTLIKVAKALHISVADLCGEAPVLALNAGAISIPISFERHHAR